MKPITKSILQEPNWFKARSGLTWQELEEKFSHDQIDSFLERWRRDYPKDPEAWVSSMNWNWNRSWEQIVTTPEQIESGFHIIKEGVDGNSDVVGLEGQKASTMRAEAHSDLELRKTCFKLAREGLTKFPYRLDIHFQTILFMIQSNRFSEVLPQIKLSVRALEENSKRLEADNYEKIPMEDLHVVQCELVHNAILKLIDIDHPDAKKLLVPIAVHFTEIAPDDAVAWSKLTYAYQSENKLKSAYKAAKKAFNLDSNDEIVVHNLATISVDMGLWDRAKNHYRWLEQNAQQPDIKHRAKEGLKKLIEK